MNYQDREKQIQALELELVGIDSSQTEAYYDLLKVIEQLQLVAYQELTAYDKVYLSRHPLRPNADQYISLLFDDFVEMHGDRLHGEDSAIKTGVAMFKNVPVTIIAQVKGKTLEDNLKTNFGMPHPEGYRKAKRIALQSEKFNRPIITIIDTPGAYPGIEAEERGQALAIAECLKVFSEVKVPVIAIVIGEGGSGGALALSVSDHIIMLEHAIYSVLSPEGFATILWKDASRASEASGLMGLTAQDLKAVGIVDSIVSEPLSGIHKQFTQVIDQLRTLIEEQLLLLLKVPKNQLIKQRYKKFRKMGVYERS